MFNQPLDPTDLMLVILTLAAFYLALIINKKMAPILLLHPLLIAIAMVIMVLWYLDIPYSNYLQSNQLFQWLIGPAVVSLAIPLRQNLHLIRQWLAPILVTIAVSISTATCIIWAFTYVFEIPLHTQVALSTKFVTTPIALSINEILNGKLALAASLVMITGIIGAILGPLLLPLVGIKDERIKGVALGLTSHVIGTQKAFEISPLCGAFAALTMSLTGIISALVLPLLIHLLIQQ